MRDISVSSLTNSYAKALAKRVAEGSLKEIPLFNGEFRWLSNFYWHYAEEHTVEHVFQAMKYGEGTLGYRNTMRCKSPAAAKRLGRQAKLPHDWDTKRDEVMWEALKGKFRNPSMREWLIATHPIPLVEGNTWHDNYWGDCQCNRCRYSPGINKLGKMLMRLRDLLVEHQEGEYSYGSGTFQDPCDEERRLWHEEELALLEEERRTDG